MSEILTDTAAIAKSYAERCESWRLVIKILGKEKAFELGRRPEADVPARLVQYPKMSVKGVG